MLGLAALLAAAMPVTVSSPAPERVSLTVYCDPARGRRQAMDLSWLGGFALVTETRTLHVPAGDAILRFEGVADGIIPASAIVTGLPGGVVEKNRDARLLSPAALVDGTLGRAVTLRRTNPATGKVDEEAAVVVAGAARGVVLRTRSGIEALRCAGLPETLSYDGVPAGLSDKPVLSVATHSAQSADVTVTLSYLAGDFDWSASYVATVAGDGRTLDLFAWLTLANGNAQGWRSVQLQAVAGRLAREDVEEIAAAAARLELRCYPLGTTTSDLPTIEPHGADADRADKIVVFARAAPMVFAPPPAPPPPPAEDLGDLKLYRVAEPVDVAPNGQKQVALLVRPRVTFEKVYRIRLDTWRAVPDRRASIAVRVRNETAAGLGIPLPAGTTALYQPRGPTRLLLGTGTVGDTAAHETTSITAGVSPQVRATQTATGMQRRITVTNANPFAARVEIALGRAGDNEFVHASARLDRVDGIQTWRVDVPANGSAALDYSLPGG